MAHRALWAALRVHAERRRGQHAFSRADSACYSAFFAAGRHDELIALIGGDPRPMWHDLHWIGRIKGATSQIDEANRATTYLVTCRLIAGKYSEIDPERVLSDLIATTPGEEGKWFATAKRLKRFDLAMQLAWKSPCDPKTLIRAAGDNVERAPGFIAEVGLAALHWVCQGRGYELTALDVQRAYRLASEVGHSVGQAERAALRIQAMLRPTTRAVRWVREIVNVPPSPTVGSS